MKADRKIKIKKGPIIVIVLMLMIGVAASAFYLSRIRRAVQDTTVASMQELAIHDRKSLHAKISDLWTELSAVYYRTEKSELQSIQEVCEGLNLERSSNIFDMIYLMDETGKTYSSTNTVQDRSQENFAKKLLAGEKQIVQRDEVYRPLEASAERILYGVRGEKPFTCGGVTFVAAIGITKSETIRNTLQISSFNEQGYTTIIDSRGNYLVNRDWQTGITDAENYFEILYTDSSLSDREISEVQERLANRENFTVQYESEKYGAEIAIFSPMKITDWIMIMSVPERVLSKQTGEFTRLALVLIGIMMVSLFIVIFVALRVMAVVITTRAESRAKEEFVASMSHEIRTPLSSIIGLNVLMHRHLEEPKLIEKYLNRSDISAQYLLALVNDVLDMAKLQAGKIDLENKPFSMERILWEVESIMSGAMERREISFHIEKELPFRELVGDSVRIQQILINMLGNGAKFTPAGGSVTLSVRQLKTGDSDVETVCEVRDTGRGMSEEFLGRIFNAFEQEKREVSDGTQGTGLGMPISYMLAKQMGGNLTVVSELGKGSCFTLKMINRVAETSVSEGKTEELISGTEQKKALHILVAEDNELNAEILMELLESAGYTSVHASDGEEAVKIFGESKPGTFDLILMDVQMPVRSGYEATKIIRGMNRPDAKTIKIFACTANTLKQEREMAAESGMDDFITKPINLTMLSKKLNEK